MSLVITVLAVALGATVALGLRKSHNYRFNQTRAFHPSGGRRVSQIRPYPHSGWFTVVAILLAVLLLLYLVGR